MSFSLLGDASPTAGVDADFAAVLIGARAGADWAWTRLYRALASPVLAYLEAHHAPDAETSVGAVFRQLAEQLHDFEGDEAALRQTALRITRQELDGWARVFGTLHRSGPIMIHLEGLPLLPSELESRHVAAAVAITRSRMTDDLRVDGPALQPPRRRSPSAPQQRR